jgi:hypothetical protein
LTAVCIGLSEFSGLSNYDNAMYRLSQLEAVTEGLKQVKNYVNDVSYLPSCDYEVEMLDKLYESIIDNSYTKKVLNNIDIPRPWFNGVMKWGAIGGYLASGNPSEPAALPAGFFFGIAQFGMVRVTASCRLYDKDRKSLPPISKNMDEKIVAKVKQYMPPVTIADIASEKGFKAKGKPIFSNAWDDKFSVEEVGRLLNLVEGSNVIRFKCSLTYLSKILSQRKGWGEYVFLNYGNVCGREFFLTRVNHIEQESRWHFVINETNYRSKFKSCMELRMIAIVDYLSSLYEPPTKKILVTRRPFRIDNWMWPQRISFKAVNKGMGITDGYSLADLGVTFKKGELIDLSLLDDKIALVEDPEPSPSSSPGTNNNAGTTNTNTNSNVNNNVSGASASLSQNTNLITFDDADFES